MGIEFTAGMTGTGMTGMSRGIEYPYTVRKTR